MNIQFIFSEIGIDADDIKYESNLENMDALGIRTDLEKNIKTKRYIILMYDGDTLIGSIYCSEKISKEHVDCPGMNLQPTKMIYIENVDIIESYQGKKLCSKMLDYTINRFSEMSKNVLYIDNQSETKDGIPACFCYTKPGIKNGYIIIVTNSEDQKFKRKLSKNTIPKKYETIESLECISKEELTGKTYFYFKKEYYYSDEMISFREQIDNQQVVSEQISYEELNGMTNSELRVLALKLGVSKESVINASDSDESKPEYIKLIMDNQNAYGAKKFKKKKKKKKKSKRKKYIKSKRTKK